MPYSGSEPDDGRCIPSLLAPSALAEKGGLAPCTAQAKALAEWRFCDRDETIDHSALEPRQPGQAIISRTAG